MASRSQRKLREQKKQRTSKLEIAKQQFFNRIDNLLGRKERSIARGSIFNQKQALLRKMTNWQRHAYHRAVVENEGPLSLERTEEIANLKRDYTEQEAV